MAEKYSFFDSQNGDRQYNSKDFADYFASFLTDGVFPDPSTNLQLESNDNYVITLLPGKAFINGYFYENQGEKDLVIDAADGVLNRIDLVVVRLDLNNRIIETTIKKGEMSENPVVPALQRDAVIFELAIAEVNVPASASKIRQADITDTRMDSTRCGWVNSLIEVDTTTIYNQYEAWFNTETDRFETEWDEWFQAMKDQVKNDDHQLMNERLTTLENEKVGTDHTHTEADISDLDKYSTSEIDQKLLGKSSTGHSHYESDITDLDKYSTSEIDQKLLGKSSTGHSHYESDIMDLDKYTKTQVDTKLSGVGGKSIDISNTNLNDLYGNGIGFYSGNSMTNAPDGNFYYVRHFELHLSGYAHQTLYRSSPTMFDQTFKRVYDKGTWTDWKQIISPMEVGIGGKVVDIYGEDINDLYGRGSGFYSGGNMTNAPNQNYYYIQHLEHESAGFAHQTLYRSSPTAYDDTYKRTMDNGVWQPWKRVSPAIEDVESQGIEMKITTSGNVGIYLNGTYVGYLPISNFSGI